ncbi:MAG: hypothetical protein JW751_12445 [Polyangiaceae bacterium]|nr:hypothetical protein [Polyangiaceae bacterium]
MTNRIRLTTPAALGVLMLSLGTNTGCGKKDDGGADATGGANGGAATEAGAPSRAGTATSPGGAIDHGGDSATERSGGSTAGGAEGGHSGGEDAEATAGSSPGGEGNRESGGTGGSTTGGGGTGGGSTGGGSTGGDSTGGSGTGGTETACEPGTQARCGDVDPSILGNCAEGTMTCRGSGTWGTCSVRAGTRDACDVVGDDADCNGVANENCDCLPGDTTPCGPETDDGLCEYGVSTCTNGVWGSCEGAVLPAARNCRSSDDNDCDGVADDTIDETCACELDTIEDCPDPDDLDGVGICQAGTWRCEGSGATAFWGSCVDAVAPRTEICDEEALDEDCDGEANEGCDCVEGDEQPCPDCTGETQACEDGQWQACTGTAPETVVYYRDEDDDGFGAATVTVESCTGAPEGYVEDDTDCCDTDAEAHPGQADWFSSSRIGNGTETCLGPAYDYGCDGIATARYKLLGSGLCTSHCPAPSGCGCVPSGSCLDQHDWATTEVPACGVSATMYVCECGNCETRSVQQTCH